MQYECKKCGMSVTNLTCGKCGAKLQANQIKNTQGQTIQVAECPQGCGKIKSPMCCQHDMTVS